MTGHPRTHPRRAQAFVRLGAALVCGGLVLGGCTGVSAQDEAACAAFEEEHARVEPYLAVLERGEIPAGQEDLVRQWTYRLADASSAAADPGLRESARLAADEAHDVVAGDPASVEEYLVHVSDVRKRCHAE